MSHHFKACYPGRCAACTEPIVVDDLLTYDREDDVAIHTECTEERAAKAKPRPICPRCFLTIALSGECGCA